MCPGGSAYSAFISTVLIFCISSSGREMHMEFVIYLIQEIWSNSDELDLEVM